MGKDEAPCETIDIRQLSAIKNIRKRRQTFFIPPSELPEGGTVGNILLYSGLILMATGLVITAVGLGDKGFRSVELRMLGPGIVIAGVCLTTIRILMCCVVSTNCYQRSNPGSMFINRTREVVDSSSRAVRSVTTDSEKFLLNQECSFNKIEKLGYCDCS